MDDTTVGGRAMLTKQTLQFVMSATRRRRPRPRAFSGGFGFNSAIFAPMMREGKVVGAIGTGHIEPRLFDDKQIALLKTFADQAVIAIENARLFNEVRQRTEDLPSRCSSRPRPPTCSRSSAARPFDLDAVLQTLVESAARLCEADKATITPAEGSAFLHVASPTGSRGSSWST